MDIASGRRGRHRTAEEWRKLIEAQRESGQTQVAFCAAQGLWRGTFARWKRRLADTHQSSAGTAAPLPMFAPLLAPAPSAGADEAKGWTVELDLGGGVCLRLRQGA